MEDKQEHEETTALERRPVVLVIDDDEVNRRVLEKLFEKEKISVHLAEDGIQGLTLAQSLKPDLILLDIFMPDEDGFEVLGRLKKNPQLTGIPVCIFSILEREESKKKAFALGACAYFTKPFNMREIVDQVKRQLAEQ